MKKYIKPEILLVKVKTEHILLTLSDLTKDMDGYAIIYDDDDWEGELD